MVNAFLKCQFLPRHFIGAKFKIDCTTRTYFCGKSTGCSLGLQTKSKFLKFYRSYSLLYGTYNKSQTCVTPCRLNLQLFIKGRRLNSTLSTGQIQNDMENLPEPPLPPAPTLQVDIPVESTLLEPTLASQGLAGWTPSGLLQSAMEFLHINLDLPWWLAIAIGTLVVRLMLFPLIIVTQRNAANMNNNLPQMQLLQMKLTQARTSGNAIQAAQYAEELMLFMREKNLNPFKQIMAPLCQAPIFMSFFFGLRGMANLPVESMKEGGLWWFTNLTIPDPFYLLPLITCATLSLTIELGVEGGVRSGNLQTMKYVLRAMPIIIFPVVINFPSAILCYWVTSNTISLAQVALLRLEPVREYFKIPKIVQLDQSKLPLKKKFVQGFRESMKNARVIRELEDRARVDDVNFRKAGTGPIQKTYSYDPTKQASSSKEKGKKL